jgi:hypothetical protein
MLAWSLIMLRQHQHPVFKRIAKRLGSLPDSIPTDEPTQLLLKQASQLLSGLDGGKTCKEDVQNVLPPWMQWSMNDEEEVASALDRVRDITTTTTTTIDTAIVPALKNAATALQQIKIESQFAKLTLLPQWSLSLRNKQGKQVVVMLGNSGSGGIYERGLLLGMKMILETRGIEGRIADDGVACDIVAECYDCY